MVPCDTYVLVAKHLLQKNADVGIFLAEAYDDLSNMIKKQLRILVRSQISVIHHSIMIGPRLLDQHENRNITKRRSTTGKCCTGNI
jgi:phosphonate transport system substrate-binding protein